MNALNLQGAGPTQVLTAWADVSLVSANREVRRLRVFPADRVCLNELALSFHTARCYAAMAGLEHLTPSLEELEDDVCALRAAHSPLSPEWLESLERRIAVMRAALGQEPAPA